MKTEFYHNGVKISCPIEHSRDSDYWYTFTNAKQDFDVNIFDVESIGKRKIVVYEYDQKIDRLSHRYKKVHEEILN